MDSVVFWIWLQQSLGYASPALNRALERFGGAEEIYKAGSSELKASGAFKSDRLARLENKSLDASHRILDKCEEMGVSLLTYEDSRYPERLRNIINPPAVLYCIGSLPDFDDNCVITVVGTRKSTPDGRRIAAALGEELARAGAVVLSGGAVGIDSAAHIGALRARGITVSVMGCGFDSSYNSDLSDMRKEIARQGLLLTEFEPSTGPTRYTFPMRNRIMSALADGVVVIEAGERSGALITASRAVEQGVDVFAVPGDIMNPNAAGVNRLIKDGATPVECAEDILSEYSWKYPHRLDLRNAATPLWQAARSYRGERLFPSGGAQRMLEVADRPSVKAVRETQKQLPTQEKDFEQETPAGLSEGARAIYELLKNGALTVEELKASAGLKIHLLLISLSELEIGGFITRADGRRYELTNRKKKQT